MSARARTRTRMVALVGRRHKPALGTDYRRVLAREPLEHIGRVAVALANRDMLRVGRAHADNTLAGAQRLVLHVYVPSPLSVRRGGSTVTGPPATRTAKRRPPLADAGAADCGMYAIQNQLARRTSSSSKRTPV